MTVILADISEPRRKTKRRDIDIIKEQVFKDIDLITHKHVDGSETQDLRMRNARESDYSEGVDGAVISRYVDYRDARLRKRISRFLVDIYVETANDIMLTDDPQYHYRLNIPEEVSDNLIRPLAQQIHRYLIYGALFDWFSQFGDSRQTEFYGRQADELEDEINSTLSGPGIAKRPLQPFGPAEKIY